MTLRFFYNFIFATLKDFSRKIFLSSQNKSCAITHAPHIKMHHIQKLLTSQKRARLTSSWHYEISWAQSSLQTNLFMLLHKRCKTYPVCSSVKCYTMNWEKRERNISLWFTLFTWNVQWMNVKGFFLLNAKRGYKMD